MTSISLKTINTRANIVGRTFAARQVARRDGDDRRRRHYLRLCHGPLPRPRDELFRVLFILIRDPRPRNRPPEAAAGAGGRENGENTGDQDVLQSFGLLKKIEESCPKFPQNAGCRIFPMCVVQGWAKKWSLGCVNSLPAARGSQEARFTQPRAHLLDNPCTLINLLSSR